MTAPVEGAVATLSHTLGPGLKPTSTAQQLTSVQAWRRAVACSPRSSQSARFAIVWAEVWRFLKVDQVHGGWGFVSRVFRLQVSGISPVRGTIAPLVGINDSGCTIKAVFQEVSNCAEAGQTHPTGAHGAGAWHAVALTLLTHLWRHSLQRGRPKAYWVNHHIQATNTYKQLEILTTTDNYVRVEYEILTILPASLLCRLVR